MAAPLGAAPTAPDVFQAFPGGPGINIEAALVVKDLRELERAYERRVRPLLRNERARAWFDAVKGSTTSGVAVREEWARALAIAAPGGQPVPMAVVVFSKNGDFGVQGFVHVADGFVERLTAASGAPGAKPPWKAEKTPTGVRIGVDDVFLHGRVDAGGWLRLALDPEMLLDGAPLGVLFQTSLEQAVREREVVVFARGGGLLSKLLSSDADLGGATPFVAGLGGVALTWTSDHDKTSHAALLVDLPLLNMLGPSVRRPDLANVLARRWGEEATGFFSMTLPMQLLGAVVPMATRALETTPWALSAGMQAALSRMDGRIGMVSFGTPGDWGLGVQFGDAAAATAAVEAFHQWLAQGVGKTAPGSAQIVALEQLEGVAGPVLHIRPDSTIEGVRISAIGSTVVATRQKRRLQALVGGDRERPAGPTVAGPVTPMMAERLSQPALVLAYTLLDSDASMFDWLTWLLAFAAVGFEHALPAEQEIRELFTGHGGLPQQMALATYVYLLMYDFALAVDVQAGVLSFDVVFSDL